MSKGTTKPPKKGEKRFIVGRAGFARISAVEGLHLSPAMKRDFEAFDRDELSATERRRAILRKYGKTPG